MSKLKKFLDKKGKSFPHLYQDQNSKEFYAVLRVAKLVRKKNLKTTDYAKALGLMNAALAELGSREAQIKVEEKGANKLLSDFWDDLVKEKVSKEVKDATLKRMDTVWKHNLKPYLGNWRADQIRPEMMPDFILWHRKAKPGAQLVNTFKYLGNLFSYMVRVGAIQIQSVPVIELPKTEKRHHDKKKGRFITAFERDRLLSFGSDEMKLIMGIAESLGMRIMEIVSLERNRVTTRNGRYFFELTEEDTKTGLPRDIPVPLHLIDQLVAQLDAKVGNPYVFPRFDGKLHYPYNQIHKEWVVIRKQAKIIGRLVIHNWRHTRATQMAKDNINPLIACTILGMTIKTYQRKYLKLTGEDLIKTVDEMLKKSDGDE